MLFQGEPGIRGQIGPAGPAGKPVSAIFQKKDA